MSRSARISLMVVRVLSIVDLAALVADYEDLWIPPFLVAVSEWYRLLNDRLTRGSVVGCKLWIQYTKTIVPVSVPAVIDAVDFQNDRICVGGVDLATGFRFALNDLKFCFASAQPTACVMRNPKIYPNAWIFVDVADPAVGFDFDR